MSLSDAGIKGDSVEDIDNAWTWPRVLGHRDWLGCFHGNLVTTSPYKVSQSVLVPRGNAKLVLGSEALLTVLDSAAIVGVFVGWLRLRSFVGDGGHGIPNYWVVDHSVESGFHYLVMWETIVSGLLMLRIFYVVSVRAYRLSCHASHATILPLHY